MKQIYLKFSMLLLCLVVGLSSAWGEEVRFTMGSGKDMSSNEGATKSNITITATDGTSNPNNWGGTTYVRLQAGGTFVITPDKGIVIRQIDLSCTDGYEKTWSASIGAAPTVNTTYHIVRWTGSSTEAITLTNTATAQARISEIIIQYSNGSPTGTPLSIPSNLASSDVTATSAVLSWDAVENASSYKVKIGSNEYDANTNSYSATGLEAETEYKWSVKALAGISNSYGDSDYSSESSFNTIAFKNSAGTYNIVPNSAFWGSTQDGAKNVSTNTEFGPKTKNGISVYMNSGKSTNSYMKSDHCRVYTGYTVTITAPVGFILTAINFTGSTWANPSADKGTMNSKSWTGSANSVNFSFSGTSYISNIEVTYVAAKTLQSIVVSGTPTKTTYQAGENFDPTGLTVTGTYDDGSNSAITSGITWAFDPATLSVGQTNCNVTATVGEISSEAYTITGLTVTEPVTLSSISVSGTPSEFWKGDTFNHNGMTVTATYSDESTADVTNAVSFSEPDMTAIGEQTVTVTYQGKEATYTINVQTIANTKETAYTVTEAKALIDAGKDLTTEVYVKGTVSDVDNYNSTYKSITYWLDEKTFEVYSGKGLGNTDFNSIDDIEVGAEVIIYGIIKKYKDTYEFDKENYLVSYVAPVHETYTITLNSCGKTINGESAIEVEEGKSVNLPQASTTATGFVFKGWSTTEQKDETNTLPTLVNNSYSPTADITLYPIFEKSETTGDTDVEIAWVIKDVSELEDNSLYVMVVTNGTNSKIVSAEKSSEDYLTGRDVTIENGIITSNVPNGYPWIFNCYGENDKTYGFTGNNTGYLYNLGVSYSNYQRWGLVSNGDKTYSMESRGNSPYNHSGTYIYLDNNTIRTTSTPSESKVQFYAQDYIEVGGTTTYTYTSYPAGEMLTITLNPACHDEDGKVYSTFSSSKAFVVPENLIVSEIAIIDGKFYVESYKTNDVVPANTGVMVSAEEGGNYLVEVAGAELSELAESVLGEENSLRPSGDNGIQSTEMSALSEGCYFYRLTMKGEQIGYYWGAPEGVAFTLAPNKAYMVIEKTAEIKSGAWINGLSTSISNPYIIADNNVIYNLNGQRISSVTKGLYIKNGKKYFVK